MVKLTTEVIHDSAQFLNPLGERELDLSRNRIPYIENLLAIQDGFDSIDLSYNEITTLDGFPQLQRLTTLNVSHNRVSRIAPEFATNLSHLETLLLANNALSDLAQLWPLRALKNVQRVVLMGNPLDSHPQYREVIAHLLPSVKQLDYNKIRPQDREAARKLFNKDNFGQKLWADLEGKASAFAGKRSASTAIAGDGSNASEDDPELAKRKKLKADLRKQLAIATSMADIERIEEQMAALDQN
eukprot:Clim_evm13s3 gene=Clim_evmTU13s3